jgi:CDP-glucose 4,6-dehydratase
VLVTGASGFLGSWLSRSLVERGANVLALSRAADRLGRAREGVEGVQWVGGDVRDVGLLRSTIRDCAVDTVFHLAGQAITGVAAREPVSTFEANIDGSWSLLEAVRSSGRRVGVVVSSSDAVYGDWSAEPCTESSPTLGTSPYATSKICAEALCRCYHDEFDTPVVIARPSNLYGGGDARFERIIPGTIRAVLRNEPPTIRSDGRPVREYLYVEDAVDAYLLLAASLDRPDVRGSAFNLSSGEPISVLDLARTVAAKMGRPYLEPRVGRSAEGEPSRVVCSSSRAEMRLGWRPRTSLSSGLELTIPWYEAHAEDLLEPDTG